ncbi:MAG: hypothetical protein Fur005_48340 [Roseiflexaceae bacterium]
MHANVNVRIEQFMYAFGVLKQQLFEHLYRHSGNNDFGGTTIALNQITDLLAACIGASYFEHELEYEMNEFSLRFKGLQKGAAIDCEWLRSSLLDWLRSTLNLLYQTPQLQLETLPRFQQSNVGLWIVYKADLLSPFSNVQQELSEQIHAINRALLEAARYRNEQQEQAFLAAIAHLNDLVSKTSWYLATLVDDLIELDSGLDLDFYRFWRIAL